MKAIDAHIHCGIQDRSPPQDLESYLAEAKGTTIIGAVAFPPVMEVYDRFDENFYDSPEWQEKRNSAHDYLLALSSSTHYGNFRVFPFLFMWNDFNYKRLDEGFYGVKWHRHPGEPVYHYDDPKCLEALGAIREKNLPIILEEEFFNTVKFIKEYAEGINVIIPHCGLLNGGYERIKAEGLWALSNVFADSALAPTQVIENFIHTYGSDKLLFGSDFPFGSPFFELEKILNLDLLDHEREGILFRNVLKLLKTSLEEEEYENNFS